WRLPGSSGFPFTYFLTVEIMEMTIKTGYKATDKNIQCRGFRFVPGQWHELGNNDPLELCKNGFHYCEQPSGVWAYYTEPDTRVWKVEVEECIVSNDPGADAKSVCRKIRLVEEVQIAGYRNTGDWNTGDRNTGDWNTGDWNTGDRNTGDRNTGDRNTGNWNTGDGNTGNRNTGNRNTGYRNTGDRNTGNWNTGNGNTGNWNTGNGNSTNNSSGFFCVQEPTVKCFDEDSGLLREEFVKQFPEYYDLSVALLSETEIGFATYSRLPGITPEKLKTLHAKHIEGRKKSK
ncbi:MAG: pentapeptide repeat-containing protein, partial [bacterium]